MCRPLWLVTCTSFLTKFNCFTIEMNSSALEMVRTISLIKSLSFPWFEEWAFISCTSGRYWSNWWWKLWVMHNSLFFPPLANIHHAKKNSLGNRWSSNQTHKLENFRDFSHLAATFLRLPTGLTTVVKGQRSLYSPQLTSRS